MSDAMVRFTFNGSIPAEEIEGTLRLACLAAESLHGADRVHLEARHTVDHATRTVIIDMTEEVGRTLALIFGGYARREFGDDAVKMTRVATAGERLPVGAGVQ